MPKKLTVDTFDKATVPCFCCGETATCRMIIQDGPAQVNTCLCGACACCSADDILAGMGRGK